MFGSVKKYLMQDVGYDLVLKNEDENKFESKAAEKNNKRQAEIVKKIAVFMFLGFVGLIWVLFFCDTDQLQRYGAVLAIIGIISEFEVVRKSQQVVIKISGSNSFLVHEFTRKRIVNWLHYAALLFIIFGTLVWAYVDIIPLEYIFFQERQ